MHQPIIILLSFFLSAFFSGAETALISVHKIRLKNWTRKRGQTAKIAAEFLARPEVALSTVLVGNNVMNVTFASFTSAYLEHHFPKGIVLAMSTLFILVFAEAIPKALTREHSTSVAQRILIPVKAWHFIFYPLIFITSSIANFLTNLTHGDPLARNLLFSRKELLAFMAEGEKEGNIEPDKRELVSAIFAFSEAPVREAMIPRTEIAAAEKGATVSDIMNLVIEKGFSRIPVYEESLDNIVGFVNVLDVMAGRDPTSVIDGLIRPIMYVPESKKCDELLLELRRQKGHIAVVIDEYGGTAGLVTVEDLLEEVVGDIYDEFDKHERTYWKIGDRSYIINARMEIDDINETLKLDLPEGEYETLGGFILQRMGRIPKDGEELVENDIRFIVAKANSMKIEKVKVVLLPREHPAR